MNFTTVEEFFKKIYADIVTEAKEISVDASELEEKIKTKIEVYGQEIADKLKDLHDKAGKIVDDVKNDIK
jgi:hypothetical protein